MLNVNAWSRLFDAIFMKTGNQVTWEDAKVTTILVHYLGHCTTQAQPCHAYISQTPGVKSGIMDFLD